MRGILATMKPVVHVPLGIAASILAMVSSVAVALSSPYPTPKARSMIVKVMPKIVVDSIPVNGEIKPALFDLSLLEEEAPPEVTLDEEPEPETKPVDAVTEAKPVDAVAEAKAYLAKTAHAGGSISRLGREKSIACFNPQFAVNLAATIRDAREHGFPEAAVFSGCRPPRLGIGGFKDKKNSLHGVGLAADIHGIGRPCSGDAKRFHKIAASHGVFGVYGPCNRAEWNHVQGTAIKMTTPALRATFTAKGDIAPDLNQMWSIERSIVLAIATPITALLATVEERHSGEGSRRHRSGRRLAERHRSRHERHREARHHERRHRLAGSAGRRHHHRTAGRHRSRHLADAD